MKKFITIIFTAIIMAMATSFNMVGQNILSQLGSHKDIDRISELCQSYNNMDAKENASNDYQIKAIYSSYKLKVLEQIGGVYMEIDYPTEQMQSYLFNIGYDIVGLFNNVVTKSKIGEKEYMLVKVYGEDIDKNKELLLKLL